MRAQHATGPDSWQDPGSGVVTRCPGVAIYPRAGRLDLAAIADQSRPAMTDRPRPPPSRSEAGQAAQAEREARRAEALRANLRKRKTQARGRAVGADAPEIVASNGGPRDGET